jgi:23S rRNA U2552 (ribose-2'-O)-methylase RlmE/FtsJ
MYDEPYKNDRRQVQSITRHFELATSHLKSSIAKRYNAKGVTNAWLKEYEMVGHYDLVPKKADTFVYFDNAAFPGAFIFATDHYVNTMCKIKSFEWYGSSLIMSDDVRSANSTKTPLEDKYQLFKNYRSNWMMDDKNNGDVTVYDNQLNICDKMQGRVDLYTSDLGFDVSKDYNKQEYLHMHANIGQILTGLLVLKKGGSMITKQYTCFENTTVSVIHALATAFERVEIAKPMFSKPGNSETYIVCQKYLDTSASYLVAKQLASALKLGVNKFSEIFPPTVPCQAVLDARKFFTSLQITTITATMDEYRRIAKSKQSDRRRLLSNNKFTKLNKDKLSKWRTAHPIKKLTGGIRVGRTGRK